jgi:hypothetical protein
MVTLHWGWKILKLFKQKKRTPAEFKDNLNVKGRSSSTPLALQSTREHCADDDCSNNGELLAFEHDLQVDACICWQCMLFHN